MKKKSILLAGIAFFVSLAAGAAGRVFLAPAPAEPRDAAATGPEGAAAGETGVPDASPPVEDASAATGPPESIAPFRGPAPVPTAEIPKLTGQDPQGVEFREMGRILSSLSPHDAGVFLGHLEDAQVLAVLRAMSIAEAAPILDRLPAERAERLKAHLFDLPRGKR